VTTATDGHVLPELDGPGRITLSIERLDLIGGDYFVDVGAYEREWAYAYDSHWRVYPLRIDSAHQGHQGVVCAPHQWRFELE